MPVPITPARLARGAALAVALLPALPASAASPGFAGAYLAARHAQAENDYAIAARFFARALERDPGRARLIEETVIARIAAGDVAQAAALAEQAGEAGGPGIAAVRLAAAARAGDFDAILEGRAGAGISRVMDTLVAGWAALGQGDSERARAAFDSMSSESPALARFNLALALALQGDFEGAQAIFEEAGGELASNRRGVLAHIRILSQIGRNDAALSLLERAFGPSLDPEMAALRTRLEAGEALPFTAVTSARDGIAELLFAFAGALDGQRAATAGLLYARLAAWIRPDLVDAHLLVGQRLASVGQHDLALAAFRAVNEDDPASYAARLGEAGALQDAGRSDEALALLDSIAARYPDLQAPHVTKGDILRSAEKWAPARAAYDAAIARFGAERDEQWSIYFARGICSERLGDWQKAEADFTHALELSPQRAEVLNYLGYSLVERRERLDTALAMIRTAVDLRPESGFIIDSLGWALYRLGRHEEALPHMVRAATLESSDPIVTDHLGDVLWAVGRRMEARFEWRRALKLSPEPELAERIRRKLEAGLDAVLAAEGETPLDAGDGD